MRKNIIILFVISVVGMTCATSCISDEVTTSPSDQPVFSVDSLKMGELFTEEMSPTFRFTVHNRGNKALRLSDVYISDAEGADFYVNVDGFSGNLAGNIEIRAKDSIYVLVKGRLAANHQSGSVETGAWLNFVTNGVTQRLRIQAMGIDAERLSGSVIDSDTRLGMGKPYLISDTLRVARGAVLTLAPGARLFMHDKAHILVEGSFRSEGTSESPIIISGDKTGNVVTDISFDLMSRQWGGISFASTSKDNSLSYTVIKNSTTGVEVKGDASGRPSLDMLNSILTNSGGTVLDCRNADITATGCQFSEASAGLVALYGDCKAKFYNCTFANNYLFTVLSGPALGIYPMPEESKADDNLTAEVDCRNVIFYGLGSELSRDSFKGMKIFFTNCLFKSKGSDDDNFKNCVWGEDPLYFTVREEYLFDYRLKKDSPAIGKGLDLRAVASAGWGTDFFGLKRGDKPSLGAFEFNPSVNYEKAE